MNGAVVFFRGIAHGQVLHFSVGSFILDNIADWHHPKMHKIGNKRGSEHRDVWQRVFLSVLFETFGVYQLTEDHPTLPKSTGIQLLGTREQGPITFPEVEHFDMQVNRCLAARLENLGKSLWICVFAKVFTRVTHSLHLFSSVLTWNSLGVISFFDFPVIAFETNLHNETPSVEQGICRPQATKWFLDHMHGYVCTDCTNVHQKGGECCFRLLPIRLLAEKLRVKKDETILLATPRISFVLLTWACTISFHEAMVLDFFDSVQIFEIDVGNPDIVLFCFALAMLASKHCCGCWKG